MFLGCFKREEPRITTGERSPWLGLSQEDNWRVHMEGKVNVGIINASMWVREDEYISVSWKPNNSPLKSLIEITSEVRESGEWSGEFSAKLDSHLPLVFRLFMFLVYDQEDANLFYKSQRNDKQCGILALDLKIFFFKVKKIFLFWLKN